MTTTNQIYATSALYDLAFSYRNYIAEVDDLTRWYLQVSGEQQAPASALELACGPARHAIELASRDIRTCGLDSAAETCELARSLMREAGCDVRIHHGDMTAFELHERFDLIVLMLTSINHVLDEDALGRHFACVAEHLSERGVYVVEFGSIDGEHPPRRITWSARRNGDHVDVVCGVGEDSGAHEYADLKGTIDGRQLEVHDRFPMRGWRSAELVAAASAAGLSLRGCYGNFTDDHVAEIDRMVALHSDTELHGCFVFAR